MGHHNFSLGEDLVSQMALRGMQEHLEERAKRKSIKAAEPEEPTQEELEGALRKLAEREIPEHVRMMMRRDRAKAESGS